jgi:hypothetical protein
MYHPESHLLKRPITGSERFHVSPGKLLTPIKSTPAIAEKKTTILDATPMSNVFVNL